MKQTGEEQQGCEVALEPGAPLWLDSPVPVLVCSALLWGDILGVASLMLQLQPGKHGPHSLREREIVLPQPQGSWLIQT